MSKEEDNSNTAILLPAASIAVFTKEKDTMEVARSLEDDWRFARVRIEVETGSVDDAIELYTGVESPDLVIVQTDNINDEFAGKLEALASKCREDTAAIVIGPVNDVYLYRKLIGMGVSDYLVKPVKIDVLSEVIAKTLLERIGTSGSYLVAVLGSRGGAGASTVSRMLALGVSLVHNQKAILLDAAGGWSGNCISLGFEPVSALHEVIRAVETGNEDTFGRMLFKVGDRLSVLATGADVMLDHEPLPEQIENLANLLMNKFPLVVFDLSRAPAPVARAIVAKASRIVLVSTPSVIDLRLARTLLHELKELRGNSVEGIDLIINKQDASPSGEVSKGDIEAALEYKPKIYLSYNPKLFVGLEGQGKLLHEDKTGRELVEKVVTLVEDIIVEKSEAPGASEQVAKFAGKKALLDLFTRKN